MKIFAALPAFLLGSTMLAGTALADPSNNDPPPHPHFGYGSGHGHPSFSAPSGNPQPTTGPTGGPAQQGSNNSAQGGQGNCNPHGHPLTGTMRFSGGLNWRDRNVSHFNQQDRSVWTSGRWWHGRHGNRTGWWWYTGGAWFFYDSPIYPYPGYASDYYAYDDNDDEDYASPDNGGYYWYYCNNPPGYYPYVQSCRGPWERVAPTPPDAQDYGPGPDGDDEDAPPPGANDAPQHFDQGPQGQSAPPDYQDSPRPGYGNTPPPGDDDEDDGPPLPPPPPH